MTTGLNGEQVIQARVGTIERELDRIYANRFSNNERAGKVKLWKILCDGFFSKYIPTNATVLDIGAGYCDFINQIQAARRIAVDLNPDTAKSAGPGVEFYQTALERIDQAMDPACVDFAFASNVFEHLRGPDVLLEVLAAIRSVLKPGGQLVIMQPNVRVLGGAFWDFVDHTLPLSEKGMVEALTLSGFETLECRARFLPYTTKGRLPRWAPLVRLYLALPPAQWLLGKQMLVVARRPLGP